MRNLYEVLGVEKDATEKDIKKAYMKAAIKYHPDKPTGNTELFQELKCAYDILSDAKKRENYDRFGFSDDLMNAWNHEDSKGRVTKEELAAFKKQYQGSQEEIDDIVKLYNDGSSLSEIAEQMWFGHIDEEPRFLNIINQQIDAGIIERNEHFFEAESEKKKAKRKRKAEKEAKEAEELAKQLYSKADAAKATFGNSQDLVSLIQARNASRIAGFDAFEAKWAKIAAAEEEEEAERATSSSSTTTASRKKAKGKKATK